MSQKRSSARGLLIALGAAAVPAFLAFWFLKGGGGIEEPTSPVAPPPAQPPSKERAKNKPRKRTDPHAARLDEARMWYDKSFFDERGRHRRLSGAKVQTLFSEADKRGYPSIPGFAWKSKQTAIYQDLLRRDRDDPDANRFFGKVPLADYDGFFDLFRRMRTRRRSRASS